MVVVVVAVATSFDRLTQLIMDRLHSVFARVERPQDTPLFAKIT